MLGDRKKILSLAKVLGNFIQAKRSATVSTTSARPTPPTGESAYRQPELAMFAHHCTHAANYPHRASSHSLRAIESIGQKQIATVILSRNCSIAWPL
mgnify:CR=1 FL=1